MQGVDRSHPCFLRRDIELRVMTQMKMTKTMMRSRDTTKRCTGREGLRWRKEVIPNQSVYYSTC